MARERRVTRNGDPDGRRQRLRRARRHRREPMIRPAPVTLEGHGVWLEPLTDGHEARTHAPRWPTASSGRSGSRRCPSRIALARTSTAALDGQKPGPLLPWAVREEPRAARSSAAPATTTSSPTSTASKSATPSMRATWQRTHVNTRVSCSVHMRSKGSGVRSSGSAPTTSTSLPAGDRGDRREEGRRDSAPPGTARRHGPRLRHVQHPGRGVA